MNPPSSVSESIFHTQKVRYFNVGKINEQQLDDYAKRKGMSREDAERWLAPNLDL